jgi:hypothetical protein
MFLLVPILSLLTFVDDLPPAMEPRRAMDLAIVDDARAANMMHTNFIYGVVVVRRGTRK